jgi:hypothetical protein
MAIFYKKSSMKIIDRQGVELFRRSINPKYYYRQFTAYGNRICGIYDHSNSKMNLIEIYNDRLELLASKLFNHELKIVYLNDFELVCKSMHILNLYYFFNFDLEQVYSIRISSSEEQHASSEIDGDDVSLVGSTRSEVFILVKSKKLIKKIDRASAKLIYEIRVSNIKNRANFDLKQISQFKLDTQSNLVFKLKQKPNRLKYYDFLQQELIDANSSDLSKFSYFDLTSQNDVYSVDNLNRIVHFI